MDRLPVHLRRQATELICTKEGPRDVQTINYGGAYAGLGVTNTYTLEKFKKNFEIKIISLDDDKLVFDMIGIDVAIANALRRIMIAEVPTMAIETVQLHQNTGVIQDEVLCHRLGLIPFKVDPDDFKSRSENEELSSENSLRFKLHIICDETNLDSIKKCLPVYSKDLIWEPLSESQKAFYKNKPPPGPINQNILITKLRPGQEIKAFCYVEKGIGKTHAKWSPSAPAVYRLQPKLEFPQGPLLNEEAEELRELCPMKVFDVEDVGSDKAAVVADARRCTTCRACIERFPDRVELRKIKDHFICETIDAPDFLHHFLLVQVETTGCIPAVEIFRRAIKVFLKKIAKLRASVDRFQRGTHGDEQDDFEISEGGVGSSL